MISTDRQSAGWTIMPAIGQGFIYPLAANTRLRGPAWIDFTKLPAGTFSLVGDHANKTGPTCIVNGFGQHTAGETFNIQIFDHDRTKYVNDPSGKPVMEVSPLVIDVDVGSLEQQNCFMIAIASFFASSRLSFASSQPCLSISVVPGIGYLGAIGEYAKIVQSDINSNRFIVWWERLRVILNAEVDKPAASFAFNSGRLDRTFDRSVKFDFDVPGAVDSKFSIVKQLTPISVVRKCKAVVATIRFITREAGLPFFLLNPSKKVTKRFVDPLQDILTTGIVCQGQTAVGSHGFQLVSLGVVVEGYAGGFPSADSFFNRRVIKRACFA